MTPTRGGSRSRSAAATSKTGIVADLAFVRVGRGLVLMTYANLAKPLPDALRADLTGKVVDRLTTELK